jgi:hypothetical protein
MNRLQQRLSETAHSEREHGEMAGKHRSGVRALIVLTALAVVLLAPAAARASFQIAEFDGFTQRADGSASTQAGEHPFEFTTGFDLTTHTDSGGHVTPDANVRTIEVKLPPGLSGNPTAVATCTEQQLAEFVGSVSRCPLDSQVGYVIVNLALGGSAPELAKFSVYNMERPVGSPALFGFNIIAYPTFLHIRLRTGEDYGLTAFMSPVSQATPVVGGSFHLWGVPADPRHDKDRGVWGGPECAETGTSCQGVNGGAGAPSEAVPRPFLSNPSNCSAGPMTTDLAVESWQELAHFETDSFVSHLADGTPAGVDGCSRLAFEPSMNVQPTSTSADSPTGLSVHLAIPQDETPEGLAEAYLKKATVTLPQGMVINPSAAAGLEGCSSAAADLNGPGPAHCPNSSRIGSVEVQTPLLDHPIKGWVYAAAQRDNPFGSLLADYVSIEDPASGIAAKLAGRVEADPGTGQLTAVFDDNPQVAFSSFDLDFFGGPRAVLRTPPTCGDYSTVSRFSSWSAGDPEAPTAAETVTSISDFHLTSGPHGGSCPTQAFAPHLSAGTTNPVAGDYGPLNVRLTRGDGTQELSSLALSFPEGLLGKLAGIPYCPQPSIDAALGRSAEGLGGLELASPSCPSAALLGKVIAGAGVGPDPFYVTTGRAYLAGPYKGAPVSMVVVAPAVAGPFDLGAVVVRTALRVDETTASIRAVSDPIPSVVHGIPLDLRDLSVEVDRSGFTINPTSCEVQRFDGTATSVAGTVAPISDRFQVGSCQRLRFRPRLRIALKGSTRRAGDPSLRAVLTQRPGEANVKRVAVTLPRSEFIDQSHIGNVCTRPQFAQGACPKNSVLGRARAFSPLLDRPLEGPVYLRSNGSERRLPDVVADLRGQIHVVVVGFVDSVRRKRSGVSRIRTTFATVPDAPVSKFVLHMFGGKRGLIQNSRNLCRVSVVARVKMKAHNAKSHNFALPLATACGHRRGPSR